MQIKTTFRFHLTLVRITKIHFKNDSRCWQECDKRGHLFIAGRVQTATATMEISVVAPWTDERSVAKSSSPTPGRVLRRLRPTTETTLLIHLHRYSAHNSRNGKQPRRPWVTDRYMYTLEYCLAIRKTDGDQSEVTPSHRDKHYMFSLTRRC